jgi:hypothetical protein
MKNYNLYFFVILLALLVSIVSAVERVVSRKEDWYFPVISIFIFSFFLYKHFHKK